MNRIATWPGYCVSPTRVFQNGTGTGRPMSITIHTIVRITPVSGPGSARKRRADAACKADPQADEECAPALPALVPGATAARSHPPGSTRHGIPGTLAAQLIAQKLPGKSERRLARYFPERALAAYRDAARILTAPATGKTV